MKNAGILFFAIVILTSCSRTIQFKIMTIKEYSTKTELGELVRDKLTKAYSMEFYQSGSQKNLIHMVGYIEPDTIYYDNNRKLHNKKKGNKTYFYANDTIYYIMVLKGDTAFHYSASNLEEPHSFSIRNAKGKIIQEADFHRNELEIIDTKEYDERGNPLIQTITIEFIPGWNNLNRINEYSCVIAKSRRTIIREYDYHY